MTEHKIGHARPAEKPTEAEQTSVVGRTLLISGVVIATAGVVWRMFPAQPAAGGGTKEGVEETKNPVADSE